MGFFKDAIEDFKNNNIFVKGDPLGDIKPSATDIYEEEKKEDGSIDFKTGKKLTEALKRGI